MKKLKYKIYSLGCKVNQYDAGKLASGLSSAGFISSDSGADLAVIHSCAVTASAIAKSRQALRRARKENPGAKIILAGCWPRAYRQEAESFNGVDLVLAKAGIKEVLLAIEGLYAFYPAHRQEPLLGANSERGGRYFLKVQDGCQQFCSYCVIPYARGPLTSRPSLEVISEAKAAVLAGFSEIVLSGIHLGLYGVENVRPEGAEKGMSLCKLIEQLSRIEGLRRIRLSSIEVTEVSDALIGLMCKEGKLCRHLHIPLQSGCDKTLKAMKRPYTTSFFKKKLAKIRRLVADVAITTDVIVAFPGENDSDFNKTMSFISELGFCRLHVFPFSAHSLTPAASMSNQVNDQVKRLRALKMRALGDKLSKQYRQAFIGRDLEVVVESFNKGCFKGRTDNYLEIDFGRRDILSANKNKKNLIGETVGVIMK
jgi:threonylcarbamoyladenosine tRNA methylthiotransferase MtaB